MAHGIACSPNLPNLLHFTHRQQQRLLSFSTTTLSLLPHLSLSFSFIFPSRTTNKPQSEGWVSHKLKGFYTKTHTVLFCAFTIGPGEVNLFTRAFYFIVIIINIMHVTSHNDYWFSLDTRVYFFVSLFTLRLQR